MEANRIKILNELEETKNELNKLYENDMHKKKMIEGLFEIKKSLETTKSIFARRQEALDKLGIFKYTLSLKLFMSLNISKLNWKLLNQINILFYFIATIKSADFDEAYC